MCVRNTLVNRVTVVWWVVVAFAILGFSVPAQPLFAFNLFNIAISRTLTVNDHSSLAEAMSLFRLVEQDNGRYLAIAQYRLGQVHQSRGDKSVAHEYFSAAVSDGGLPTVYDIEARLKLADWEIANGSPQSAIALLSPVVERPDFGANRWQLAYIHTVLAQALIETEQSDLDTAAYHLNLALRLHSDAYVVNSHLNLLYTFLGMDDTQSRRTALAMADELIQVQPKNTWAALAKCRTHLGVGDTDQAILWCKRSVDLSRRNDHAYYWLGIAYSHQERWPDALDAFERAYKLKPSQAAYAQAVRRAQRNIEE